MDGAWGGDWSFGIVWFGGVKWCTEGAGVFGKVLGEYAQFASKAVEETSVPATI